jgi:hypothetical protein
MKLSLGKWEQEGQRNGKVYRRVRVRGKWTPIAKRVR